MEQDVTQERISNVGFLQFSIIPGDIHANLEQMNKALRELNPPPGSLVVLPEMWATGFVYEQLAELTQEIPQLLVEVEALAASRNIVIAGSLPQRVQCDRSSEAVLRNTLFFSGSGSHPPPAIAKQHLFAFWQEDSWFEAGPAPAPVKLSGGDLLAGMVCYDLRFPESVRSQCQQGADLIVVSAQWPLARIFQWKTLLQARAIENQAFVVASNCCGRSGGTKMGGHSLVVAPNGEILGEAGESAESFMCPLDRELLHDLRMRFNTVAPASWMCEDGDKLFELDDLALVVGQRRAAGQKIVFTNGCFDILHAGHVDYLQKARRQGDFLVLGLNNDASISSIKGPLRPINSELNRARVLAALGCVDAVVLFGEDTPLDLISRLLPDVLVKGADWEEDEIAGAAEVKAAGGRVERIPFVSETSTTGLIDQIRAI